MKEDVNSVCSNLVGSDGRLNDLGNEVLVKLLGHLPAIHRGKWGPVFVPLTRLLVRSCVDLAIIDNNNGKVKVLLTKRTDKFFKGGWHFPGGSLGPGETVEEAAQRIAFDELGVELKIRCSLGFFNHVDNPRGHDAACLLLCEIKDGKPREGTWFCEQPAKLLNLHKESWDAVEVYLRQ